MVASSLIPFWIVLCPAPSTKYTWHCVQILKIWCHCHLVAEHCCHLVARIMISLNLFCFFVCDLECKYTCMLLVWCCSIRSRKVNLREGTAIPESAGSIFQLICYTIKVVFVKYRQFQLLCFISNFENHSCMSFWTR